MSCPRPIDAASLIDHWFGELPEEATDRLEEHLLECDDCCDRLRALIGLRDDVRRAGRLGLVPLVATGSFLEAAARGGLRLREYRLAPGGRAHCTIGPEDDLLIGRLEADFSGVLRLDVVVDVEGRPELRLEDVPVSSDAAELVWVQATPASRALGHVQMSVRLLAVDGGSERVVGDYVFDHHPSNA